MKPVFEQGERVGNTGFWIDVPQGWPRVSLSKLPETLHRYVFGQVIGNAFLNGEVHVPTAFTLNRSASNQPRFFLRVNAKVSSNGVRFTVPEGFQGAVRGTMYTWIEASLDGGLEVEFRHLNPYSDTKKTIIVSHHQTVPLYIVVENSARYDFSLEVGKPGEAHLESSRVVIRKDTYCDVRRTIALTAY